MTNLLDENFNNWVDKQVSDLKAEQEFVKKKKREKYEENKVLKGRDNSEKLNRMGEKGVCEGFEEEEYI